jgi:hypothetical protein
MRTAPGLTTSAPPDRGGLLLLSLAAFRGAERPPRGTGTGTIEDARGLPCSMAQRCLSHVAKGQPCRRRWPSLLAAITCAIWPDLKICDLNLTTDHIDAGFAGFDGGPRFSTSSRIEPARWTIVVDSPSVFSAGTPTTEFGASGSLLATLEEHAPVAAGANRVPGFSTSSCFSDACCTPLPMSQTSPEDG